MPGMDGIQFWDMLNRLGGVKGLFSPKIPTKIPISGVDKPTLSVYSGQTKMGENQMEHIKYPEEIRADHIERTLTMSEYICDICGATIQSVPFKHPWKDWLICWECLDTIRGQDE